MLKFKLHHILSVCVGVVVVGGLVSSTALTLVLLPLLFARFGLSRQERVAEAAAQPTENV